MEEILARDTGPYPHYPIISISLDVYSSGYLEATLLFEAPIIIT